MTGGKGDDVFVFAAGNNADTITDFEDGKDLMDVSDYGFTDIGEFVSITDVAGDAVIDINGSDSITLENFDVLNVDNGDFIFV